MAEHLPCSVSLEDSSSLCESLQSSWPQLQNLTITDVSVGDTEAKKILRSCITRANNQLSLENLM